MGATSDSSFSGEATTAVCACGVAACCARAGGPGNNRQAHTRATAPPDAHSRSWKCTVPNLIAPPHRYSSARRTPPPVVSRNVVYEVVEFALGFLRSAVVASMLLLSGSPWGSLAQTPKGNPD